MKNSSPLFVKFKSKKLLPIEGQQREPDIGKRKKGVVVNMQLIRRIPSSFGSQICQMVAESGQKNC